VLQWWNKPHEWLKQNMHLPLSENVEQLLHIEESAHTKLPEPRETAENEGMNRPVTLPKIQSSKTKTFGLLAVKH